MEKSDFGTYADLYFIKKNVLNRRKNYYYTLIFFFLFDSFDCLNGIGSTYIVEESVALEMLLAKVRAQHSSEQHYTEKSRRNWGGPARPILHIS